MRSKLLAITIKRWDVRSKHRVRTRERVSVTLRCCHFYPSPVSERRILLEELYQS